jgi:hypothetical protein
VLRHTPAEFHSAHAPSARLFAARRGCVVALIASALSCSIADLDYTGKSCATAPCPGGWSCNADSLCARGSAAADWTPALAAVYRFEDGAVIGRDSSGHGNDLVATGDVSLSTAAPVEGIASVHLDYGTLSSTSAAFDVPPSGSFTTGGWFRTARYQSQLLIQKLDSAMTSGYFLDLYNIRPSSTPGLCQTGLVFQVMDDDPTCQSALTCDDLTSEDPSLFGSCNPDQFAQVWMHLVARYDASAQPTPQMQVFVAGVPNLDPEGQPSSGQAPSGIGTDLGPFELGCATGDQCGFTGEMDEIFYADEALSDEAIGRIYACGIDGRHCQCAGDGSGVYVSRGRAEADAGASALPPCGAPGP